VPDAVEVAFHRAAALLLDGCGTAVVAVSGGGDSVALLHLMVRLSPKRRPRIVVAHLDHGLRPGSAADRRFVVALAGSLDLPSVAARRDVAAARRKDESLEEAARRVRRAFLADTARNAGAEVIATGHTLDDQAETILMRWARGAGPTALAAMAPAGPGPFVKPLLGLERSALRSWLAKRRLPFLEDPSNESLAFDRNRVRRLVVPVLSQALNPAAARHLVEAAARLREDAALLDAQARECFLGMASRRGKVLALRAPDFSALPHPLAARVARIALETAGCDPRRISSRHVDAVVALATARPGSSLNLPGRIEARGRAGLVEFRPCASRGRS
jgi:tRNA(Ile)-lysidine synthase